MNTVEVEKEMGDWVVRVNGMMIYSFWREAAARRLAMRLMKALVPENQVTSGQE